MDTSIKPQKQGILVKVYRVTTAGIQWPQAGTGKRRSSDERNGEACTQRAWRHEFNMFPSWFLKK